MTENEAIVQLNFDMEMIRFNPNTGETLTLEQIKARNENNYKTYLADEMAITALMEIQELHKIGTIEEFKDLKEKEDRFDRNIRMFNSIGLEIRANAIDEAIEASAKAICVGCGYLDGYKCTYNGGNCGVSKPMLESVMKALEQLKGGAVDG